MKTDTVYYTTPIYYPNADPHLGTAYTTIAVDVLTRWARLKGYDVYFLTGLDEHGKKIENAARDKGWSPQELVDRQAENFRQIFGLLNVKYDRFIRTTDPDHVRTVQSILQRVFTGGDIYKGTYEGLYCVECETYYTEKELLTGCCPIHRTKKVELLSEECYYFRLSKYQPWLLEYYNRHPSFIQPRSRRNEVFSFVSDGLDDLNISRSTFRWGIPLPFDEGHVAYVWFDALINYITGVGFIDHPREFERYWPNAIHLIGKDILRFHTVIWPAMLHSAGIEPPKAVFAHGFWNDAGRKLSKSQGNVLPLPQLVETYGLDPLRYYLFRAVEFGNDGDFSLVELVRRNNAELAQGLGNLVQRTISMLEKYCGSVIPRGCELSLAEQDVREAAMRAVRDYSHAMENFAFQKALDSVLVLIGDLNSFLNEKKPWSMAAAGEKVRVCSVLATVAEGIRIAAVLVSPFMPASSSVILDRLGIVDSASRNFLTWTNMLHGRSINPGAPIFPLIEMPTTVPVDN